MLEKNTSQKKVLILWNSKIKKFRKVCTHKGIGKMLKKNTSQRKVLILWNPKNYKSVEFVKNSKIKKCFWKVCTYKCIRIVEYLEKIQVRKKCWFCEILKSRNFWKVCTHKGIGKMLKKNTSQRKVLILWNPKI